VLPESFNYLICTIRIGRIVSCTMRSQLRPGLVKGFFVTSDFVRCLFVIRGCTPFTRKRKKIAGHASEAS
jgi:hypothetical protein